MPVGGSQSTDQRNHNYVNEITQRTLAGGSPGAFQYDGKTGGSNGNLKNDGTLIYAYDTFNRLIQVNRVSDGLVIATYVYDAMNRRVRKTILNGGLTGNIPTGTTDYIWQGWQCVEERNPFGGTGSADTPIRQYIWGTYVDECIQLATYTILGPQSLPAGAYYLLQDLLYRAVALTNSSGGIVETYDTDAYGVSLIFTGPRADNTWFTDEDVQGEGANDIIYCGYPNSNRVSTDIGTGLSDPECELYYVRNRTYGSIPGTVLRQEPKSRQATGVAARVLQRDPMGYAAGINLYEYVGDNPAAGVDASGGKWVKLPYELCKQYVKEPHWYSSIYDMGNASSADFRGKSWRSRQVLAVRGGSANASRAFCCSYRAFRDRRARWAPRFGRPLGGRGSTTTPQKLKKI